MVPAGNTIDVIISTLKNNLNEGDIVIDGSNSHYTDTIARARELEKIGVHFLDCGTGGGIEGALNGISAMVGGKKEIADYCEPLFKSICVQDGYLYCGRTGNGHFTKMAYSDHNLNETPILSEGIRALHRHTGKVDLVQFAYVGRGHQSDLISSWLN
jgi:6-phosphogluconate dehydrogenase